MSDNAFHSLSFFWLLAGVLIGVGATLAFGSLWRTQVAAGRRGIIIAAGSTLAMAVVAVLLYSVLGRPDLLGDTTASHVTDASTTNANAAGDPKSMEAVTAQLAARLARDGGADSDWQLLAQSYDFMGRTEDAARARKHAASESIASAPTAANSALLATANAARLQRKHEQARAAYESAIKANAMTADSWADYADVLASTNQGQAKLSGAPAQAIDKALALDPNHTKALWLKASLAHEEHRYADALVSWQHLRSVIGDNESDARIIDANIAEARELAGGSLPTNKPKPADRPANKPIEVSGTVDIDPKLLARATAGATLFIFAKTDSPGPPLAVLRTAVGKWPITFKLDDTMAMMPSRNLSSATDVIVEARISQSGQAAAAAGDLQAVGARVKVRDGKAVHLRIDKVVS